MKTSLLFYFYFIFFMSLKISGDLTWLFVLSLLWCGELDGDVDEDGGGLNISIILVRMGAHRRDRQPQNEKCTSNVKNPLLLLTIACHSSTPAHNDPLVCGVNNPSYCMIISPPSCLPSSYPPSTLTIPSPTRPSLWRKSKEFKGRALVLYTVIPCALLVSVGPSPFRTPCSGFQVAVWRQPLNVLAITYTGQIVILLNRMGPDLTGVRKRNVAIPLNNKKNRAVA